MHTLAHELTHVQQQRRGPVSGTDTGTGVAVSDPSDPFEQEAEAAAQAVSGCGTGAYGSAGIEPAGPATFVSGGIAVQRDEGPADAGAPAATEPEPSQIPPDIQALIGTDSPIEVSLLDPLAVPDPGAGDFPGPTDTGGSAAQLTVMALLDDSVPLQRDDEAPHVGVDVGVGATGAVAQTPGVATPTPFQLQMTILYRGLNGWASADGNWEVLHEPSIQFVGDSALPMAPVSIQESITLINTHWMPPWQKEIEVGLSTFAQQQIVPKWTDSVGAQLQVEQHITPIFSITGTLTGTYTGPASGETTASMSLTAGAGLTIHLDSLL
jgi:hypothetical protein